MPTAVGTSTKAEGSFVPCVCQKTVFVGMNGCGKLPVLVPLMCMALSQMLQSNEGSWSQTVIVLTFFDLAACISVSFKDTSKAAILSVTNGVHACRSSRTAPCWW